MASLLQSQQQCVSILVSVLFILFLAPQAGGIITLPQNEDLRLPITQNHTGRRSLETMDAIKSIAQELNKKDWNFSDPCSNQSTVDTARTNEYINEITCVCSISTCHIQSFNFSGQDLDGTLPLSISKLPHLKAINLRRNFLSGSIPREWGSKKLESLSMESNLFSGTIPSTLGNLVNLEYLNLIANNLTGQFPLALTNLTKLTILRISSNYFKGKMPDFGGLKQLQRLEMEASGFDGPIHSSLSNLSSLTELRITDLNGWESSNFPDLSNMIKLRTFGPIPEWNKLRGFSKLIDISYNNFSETPESSTCTDNFFEAHRDRKTTHYYSLHINCGGEEVTIGNITYEGDEELVGAAYYLPKSPWGISNTGDFYGAETTGYIANSESALDMLYRTARISPLSLTYFGRCLANGSYTVKLHFSEIIFRDNKSYFSLGRRIFDVYVQGKLEFKDFNIEKNASGVDKETVKVVKPVVVSDKTLEIRLQWTGKGTRNVPKIGSYGSLISAISVEPYNKPPNQEKEIESRKSNTKLIIVGAVSSFCLLLIALAILWWKYYFGSNDSRKEVLRGLDLQTGYMAPEYAMWGYLTDKADVYSFGVMALEIVAGKNNTRFRPNENFVCLLDWATFLQQNGDISELVDPNFGSKFKKEEANRVIKVALLCINPSPSVRPTMSKVVSMLEGKTTIPELIMNSSNHDDPFKFTGLRDKLDQTSQQSSNEAQYILAESSNSSSWIDYASA
ncbi:hypothetical protein F8388_021019 [Cannabis sativa]|uniref:non-specific serine/threonine protein kinase n=1 Tax=Cannabis sativa TaxID=3483 RepID=A0A7J6DTV7_CANSA|nr:hypothetical protein F8388_021019 [Cannabis sativa]